MKGIFMNLNYWKDQHPELEEILRDLPLAVELDTDEGRPDIEPDAMRYDLARDTGHGAMGPTELIIMPLKTGNVIGIGKVLYDPRAGQEGKGRKNKRDETFGFNYAAVGKLPELGVYGEFGFIFRGWSIYLNMRARR